MRLNAEANDLNEPGDDMTDNTTTGAAPAAAAPTIAISMPTTPPAIKTGFEKLLGELEAIPGDVTNDLAIAKEKILAAISWVESHFTSAKATAETDAASIKTVAETDVATVKTDATDVQAAVEKAA